MKTDARVERFLSRDKNKQAQRIGKVDLYTCSKSLKTFIPIFNRPCESYFHSLTLAAK